MAACMGTWVQTETTTLQCEWETIEMGLTTDNRLPPLLQRSPNPCSGTSVLTFPGSQLQRPFSPPTGGPGTGFAHAATTTMLFGPRAANVGRASLGLGPALGFLGTFAPVTGCASVATTTISRVLYAGSATNKKKQLSELCPLSWPPISKWETGCAHVGHTTTRVKPYAISAVCPKKVR